MVQWLFVFCFSSFCTTNVDKWGGKLKAIRCCCTVVVFPSIFFFFFFFNHPSSGQCSGNEVQRVSQVILHSGAVHVCIYVYKYSYTSPLDDAISMLSMQTSHSCQISVVSPFFSFCCGLNVLVDPSLDKMSVREQAKLRLIFLTSIAF